MTVLPMTNMRINEFVLFFSVFEILGLNLGLRLGWCSTIELHLKPYLNESHSLD